jgi:hypothetical protein
MATKSTVNVAALESVPGWFQDEDFALIRWFFHDQAERGICGDLAELGCYQGKSAIVIGEFQNQGEQFTVVDLFDVAGADPRNHAENAVAYADLTQAAFEQNYLRFHNKLPTVVRGCSSEVLAHAERGRHRLVHVDASHLFDHVREDIFSARELLSADGVVVLDDYRSKHTPGTAAAVWQAVANDGLRPIAVSPMKFYGTWGDPASVRTRLSLWLAGQTALQYETQVVCGVELVRVWRLTHPLLVLGSMLRSRLPRSLRPTVRRLFDGKDGLSPS